MMKSNGFVGLQNESSQDVPLWYVHCFELQATKTLWTEEKLLPLLELEELGVLSITIDYQR